MLQPETTATNAARDTRLMVVDPTARRTQSSHIAALPALLEPGDLLVLNDAATLPASLFARTRTGAAVEIRLLGIHQPHAMSGATKFRAVLFGAGDYRTRTEDRPAPPPLTAGERLVISAPQSADAPRAVDPQLMAEIVGVSDLSPRLVELALAAQGAELWSALYACGRPVQYANQPEPLPLWAVQTAYASRPWAAEMPSAGRPLSVSLLSRIERRGVTLATLTHAAGLSATGDPAIDRALPLPERYDVPYATVRALERTRAEGGRVIAVGTSVVRALESAYLRGAGHVQPGEAETSLRIGPEHTLRVVTGLLTGIHAPEESHFELLRAFATRELLARALEQARQQGYREHEFGDSSLVLKGTLAAKRHAA